MDTRLLVRALHSLRTDFEERNLLSQLSDLASKAQTASQNPADASAQAAFVNSVLVLRDTLAKAATNDLPISLRRTLADAKLADLTAREIADRLEPILRDTPFVLTVASDKIQKLHTSISSRWKSAYSIITSVDSLQIADSGISSAYEAGILMPTTFTGDNLRVLDQQLKGWIRVIDGLEELAYGKTSDNIHVTGLSQGSFDVFVALAPLTSFALLMLARGVVRALQVSVDADKKADELQKIGYSEDLVARVREEGPGLIGRIRDETTKAILEFLEKANPIQDKPRRAELRTKLSFSFDFALKASNHGVDVEVSTPPKAPKATEAEQQIEKLHEKIDQLRLDLANRTAALPDRSKPLLELPESDQAKGAEDRSGDREQPE